MEFDWFQVALSFAFVAAAGAFALGGGAIRAPQGRRPGAIDDDRASRNLAVVRIEPGGRILPSRGAQALLGGFSSGRVDIKTLAARFRGAESPASDAREFEAALRRLVSEGVGFRLVVETKAGRFLRAVGEPRGARLAVLFQDETDLRRELIEARAEARRKADEARAREAALNAAAGPCWIVGAGGGTSWRSAAFLALPAAHRGALEKAGASGAAEAEMAAGEGRDQPVYALARAPLREGETLIVARPSERQAGRESAFSRFVNTMSETFAHLKVALMIFDGERRLTLFNPATAHLFGGDPAWLARRPTLRDILDHMREARSIPEQTDYVGWRDALLARLEGEAGGEFDEHWHLPDGRSIHVVARPHSSGGLAVTAEDISESVALRRRNAAERAVLHATTDFLEEALIVFGPDGLSRVVNEQFLRLWDYPEDAFARPVHVRAVAAHCEALSLKTGYWAHAVDAATGGGRKAGLREKVELTSGRVLSARFSPMPDGSSLLVLADITASERVAAALRERNEALEHADEVRGALVDQISHQMRTPLNAVFGFGQLLGDERFGALNARQREYVAGIVSSSTELLDAINGMTDLISVGSDSMSLGGELFDPVETLQEVIDLAARRFEGRGSLIEAINCGVDRKFRAHRVRLRQIVFNMLMDALTKSEPGGRVEINIALSDHVLTLRCLHQPAAGEGVGDRGLAIALIRRFAGLHGGDVDVALNDQGLRELVCNLPECEAPPFQAPLLLDPPLAASARTV